MYSVYASKCNLESIIDYEPSEDLIDYSRTNRLIKNKFSINFVHKTCSTISSNTDYTVVR